MTHLPGARNPTDPLSRRGFADGNGPAASTGDPDAESQQELFSRLGRDAPGSARLAAIRAGWAVTRRAAAAAFVQGGDAIPPTSPWGGGPFPPPCTSMFVSLAGSELSLGTGTTPAPFPPTPSDDLFLAPAFVQTLAAELAVDTLFGPILRGAAAALGKLIDRLCTPIVDRSRSPGGGLSWYVTGSCTAAGRAHRTVCAIPQAAGCARRYLVSAMMAS